MPMQDEWRAIHARIDGFAAGASVAVLAHTSNSGDIGLGGTLSRHYLDINDSLSKFSSNYSKELPYSCATAIKAHLGSHAQPNPAGGNTALKIASMAMPLTILAAELDYLLRDSSLMVVRRSERAFEHLNRSIEVNDLVRKEWIEAYGKGETACERIGSVHLLSHGIFAFKIDALGARTDLIFQNELDAPLAEKIAEGLVLTEWKKVSSPQDAAAKAIQAKTQADRYRSTALAALELQNYRYIVLVSLKHLTRIQDIREGGVLYRHINIVVDPESPSVQARSTR
jgi:hypothetical protein